MTDETCEALRQIAEGLAIRIAAEWPEGEEVAPYYPEFAATFRHDCTNYDELLAVISDYKYSMDCVCSQSEDEFSPCDNEEQAHLLLKHRAAELGRRTYLELRIESQNTSRNLRQRFMDELESLLDPATEGNESE